MNKLEQAVISYVERTGISQRQLAIEIGLNHEFFNRVVKHPERTSSKSIVKVSEYIGADRTEMLECWKEEKKKHGMSYVERFD